MRAARLLDMLLGLQHRGNTTSPQLAETLEVSERTVLRDVEALSEAGVPIFTARGAGSGIELTDGLQRHLTALTTDEAGCRSRNRIPHGALRRLARGVQRRREVEVTIARQSAVTVRPLGLALKAGSWYLVCAGRGDIGAVEVVCIDDLRATRLTNRRFTPPAGFDLTDFWSRRTLAPR